MIHPSYYITKQFIQKGSVYHNIEQKHIRTE
jgi:hypothetical protein